MTGTRGKLMLLGAVAALTALAFTAAPQLDLWFSGLFYDPETGFVMRGHPVGDFFHRQMDDALRAVFALVLAASLVAALRGRPVMRCLTGRDGLVMAVVLAIAVGLIVNLVLKEHWGRARPDEIAAFGGASRFSPALIPSDQCSGNCSFPSGHAAFGFATVTIAMIARQHRAFWFCLAIGFGSLVGLMRVMRGSHFLSDVIFAGLIVIGTAVIAEKLIQRSKEKDT